MQILNVNDIAMEFNGIDLFNHVSFSINEKDRLALIGPNGNGKTTVLRIINGELSKKSGEISFAKGTTIGYLSQEVIKNVNRSLYDEVLEVFKPLIDYEEQLKKMEEEISLHPDNEKLINDYGYKQNNFTNMGGYDYHYQMEMMLSKFGFHEEDLNRQISSFSGGERTKIAFVKLLLIKPNLLILDEPTNHLDISTIEWLETYLKSYEGALLFVSHDRYFIDALANKIVEIENGTSAYYKGNYSYYVDEKKLRYEQSLASFNAQQKEIARIKRFIEFYKPKPRFAARAKDREKKLEHMTILDKPVNNNKTIKLNFEGDVYQGKEIIRVSNLFIGYDYPLIENINFSLYGGDRIAIMGSNGCGKTTLLESLVNHKHILSGEVKYVRTINIGYIKQHQDDLNPENTIIEEMMANFGSMGEKNLYNHLGKFNFDYEDCSKKISVLSGGEKMRVTLAKIILENFEVLVLDEPTNHLDMVTRQALTLALNDYKGAIIFVSHDRYFVDELANHVLYIDESTPYFINGNYMDFKEQESKLLELNDSLKKKDTMLKENKVKVFNDGKPVQKKVSLKLEESISALEKKIAAVKEDQFKEENYMDYKKSQALDKQLKELEKQLEELEKEYLS